MLVKFLVVLCVVSAAYAEKAVINNAVDKLLSETRAEIKRSGRDTLNIVDLEHPFVTKWHFIKIYWLLHCTDGWVNSISTLQRTGDIVLSNNGPEISLLFEMGMSDVELSFRECRIIAKHLFSVSTRLWSKVKQTRFRAKISLRVDDEKKECNATLNDMELTLLKGVTLKTGDGILSGFKDHVIEAIIRKLDGRFTRIVSNHLNEIIRDYHYMDLFCRIVHDLNTTNVNNINF